MPSKKKSPREMTTDEIAKKVFPKKVIQVVKELGEQSEKHGDSESSQKEYIKHEA